MICDSSLFRLLEEKVRIHQKMGFAVIRSLMKRLRRLTDHLLLIKGGKIQDIKLTQCRREGIMDLRQQYILSRTISLLPPPQLLTVAHLPLRRLMTIIYHLDVIHPGIFLMRRQALFGLLFIALYQVATSLEFKFRVSLGPKGYNNNK
jgi:hypothetical protein